MHAATAPAERKALRASSSATQTLRMASSAAQDAMASPPSQAAGTKMCAYGVTEAAAPPPAP